LEDLVRRKGTLRLRVIDIVNWDSEVAQQHGIQRLPTLALYDGRELVSDDLREVIEILER